jgi:hypothetical protein
MKVIINRCHGGFGLSALAISKFGKLKGEVYEPKDKRFSYNITNDLRCDPDLIKVVEELGYAASSDCAVLEVVDVPDGVDWVIDEYDGKEWVAEVHRTWG